MRVFEVIDWCERKYVNVFWRITERQAAIRGCLFNALKVLKAGRWETSVAYL